jgi:hypothetical protein
MLSTRHRADKPAVTKRKSAVTDVIAARTRAGLTNTGPQRRWPPVGGHRSGTAGTP